MIDQSHVCKLRVIQDQDLEDLEDQEGVGKLHVVSLLVLPGEWKVFKTY